MKVKIVKLDLKYGLERVEIIWKNKQFFAPFLSWVDFVNAKQDAIDKMLETIEREKDGKSQTFHILLADTLVGQISIFDVTECTAEIGYWLDQDFCGKGIMTQAIKLICKYGFEELILHRIEIRCDPKNEPSKKVAFRCGCL